MKYVLGIDLGTSGTKTVLFDQEGKAMASATVEYPMYQPQNGWAEQDPADWANAAIATIQTVLARSGVAKEDVVSLGISGQMHGLVMLDEDNQVIRPSIIWCDQRTAKECEEITARVGYDTLIRITANPALPGFTLSKLMWVRNHEPENYARCRHVLLPKDYVRFVLTGDYATEVSDASGMQMLDVPNRCWSDELLGMLDIDKNMLAKVYESCEVTGHISAEAAKKTGLSEKTLVVGGAGDNAAAAVGTGVVEDGKAFTTIGTSGVVFAHTDKLAIDPKGRVHTFCCAVPGAWHVMGVTQAAGLSLKWFRDTFCAAEKEAAAQMGVDPYELTNKEAAQSPIGANKLLYAPYLMGERTPHLDSDCRGMFFGLSAMHQRRDLLRAVMEGVSFSLNDCLGILAEMGVAPETMLACGGGGKSPLWRQMLADVMNCPVATTVNTEGPALGVAILASVGAGLYPSVQEACRQMIKVNPAQDPIAENVPKYAKVYAVYQQLYTANKDLFKQLGGLDA
ncbi:MAG: xylulokinase [Clostridia bacterium]|nr:xylulokinase [Clostridia bacterium]